VRIFLSHKDPVSIVSGLPDTARNEPLETEGWDIRPELAGYHIIDDPDDEVEEQDKPEDIVDINSRSK
jgi:hypothetical protein